MLSDISPTMMRRIILTQSKRAHVGHIGSCLSIVEILSALYGGVLHIPAPRDPERDRFVLSKGHGALALYAALALRGWLSDVELNSFCGDGSLLGVHPEWETLGIDFSTGSLGHGLCFSAGAALAAKMRGSERRVYCLISDAECNEGSVWEAAMFAAHHRLGHLTAIIDVNGQQAFGVTSEVLNTPNLRERWEAFGWNAVEVDGHDAPALTGILSANRPSDAAPLVVVAHTVFGRGVSYMEKGESLSQGHVATQPINWHYLPMSDEEFKIAVMQVEAGN